MIVVPMPSYSQLTVLDISPAAIAPGKARLGVAAERVRWLAADTAQCAQLHETPFGTSQQFRYCYCAAQ
jgi:hypothetical protein